MGPPGDAVTRGAGGPRRWGQRWDCALAVIAAYTAYADGDVSELTTLVLDNACDIIHICIGLSQIHDF